MTAEPMAPGATATAAAGGSRASMSSSPSVAMWKRTCDTLMAAVCSERLLQCSAVQMGDRCGTPINGVRARRTIRFRNDAAPPNFNGRVDRPTTRSNNDKSGLETMHTWQCGLCDHDGAVAVMLANRFLAHAIADGHGRGERTEAAAAVWISDFECPIGTARAPSNTALTRSPHSFDSLSGCSFVLHPPHCSPTTGPRRPPVRVRSHPNTFAQSLAHSPRPSLEIRPPRHPRHECSTAHAAAAGDTPHQRRDQRQRQQRGVGAGG